MHEASLDIIIKIQGEPNFLYVCQSVSCLTSLLKLDKYGDISCSWWDIFLNFFGDIPEMSLHFFQIITNFLYVCQYVSWLTFLLKSDKYRDISCSGWDIFLNFFGGIPWTFVHLFQKCWIFCMSVSLLIGLLPYWNQTNIGISLGLDEISFWNFLETFLVRIQVMSAC